jgi:hypothetical protein
MEEFEMLKRRGKVGDALDLHLDCIRLELGGVMSRGWRHFRVVCSQIALQFAMSWLEFRHRPFQPVLDPSAEAYNAHALQLW